MSVFLEQATYFIPDEVPSLVKELLEMKSRSSESLRPGSHSDGSMITKETLWLRPQGMASGFIFYKVEQATQLETYTDITLYWHKDTIS